MISEMKTSHPPRSPKRSMDSKPINHLQPMPAKQSLTPEMTKVLLETLDNKLQLQSIEENHLSQLQVPTQIINESTQVQNHSDVTKIINNNFEENNSIRRLTTNGVAINSFNVLVNDNMVNKDNKIADVNVNVIQNKNNTTTNNKKRTIVKKKSFWTMFICGSANDVK